MSDAITVGEKMYRPNREGNGLAARWRPIALCGLLAAVVGPVAGAGDRAGPPPNLVALEKKVSLKIAHVRLNGPTNAADLKQLGEAQRLEMEGEKAITAGDYKGAEQDFLRANVIISSVAE